jgi:MFS transporter, MHS family, proline/betaine transporter
MTSAFGRFRRRRHTAAEYNVELVDESKVRRAVAAAAIGNTMEWFDFGVYSYIAVTLGQVFFPAGDPTAQLLSTFAAFAVAFLVRPLGGFFFGPLGDRIGRRRVLATTMLTMAAGTLLIGLIPSYSVIGVWAPILLLLARLVQGFSTGGEYGGAATFVSEYSPDRRRGFMASWLEFGTFTGYALGAGVVTVLTATLSEPDMLAWGWRIPFLAAGPLGLIGLYLRFRLEETPAYEEERRGEEGVAVGRNYRKIFVEHWRSVLQCIGLVAVFNATNYMLTAYMPTYLTTALGYRYTSALVTVLVTMVLIMGLIIALGRFSDRIGRIPVVITGCGALIVLSWPVFWLLSGGAVLTTLIALVVLGLMLICFSSTMPSTLPALFPTGVRYGGVAISYNISVALFGGTTPLISEALIAGTGIKTIPALLLMAAGVIGLVAALFTRESARRALPGSAPTATTQEEARRTAEEQDGPD